MDITVWKSNLFNIEKDKHLVKKNVRQTTQIDHNRSLILLQENFGHHFRIEF